MALPLREPAPIRPGGPDLESRHRSIERELRPMLSTCAGDLADAVLELDVVIAKTRRERRPLSGTTVRRRRVGSDGTPAPPAVRELLSVLARCRIDSGAHGPPPTLAARCHAVALWAHTSGALLTAVTFVQAAYELDRVRASPDPYLAYEVGRLAASQEGLAGPASDWLAFAALHARRLRRYDLLALSLRALATLFARGGDPVSAQRLRVLASRADHRGWGSSAPDPHLPQ